ncbi:pyridoxamine 5'-phosphate oxidase family protein [Rhodococcus sp. MS13]|uniref:pyridoxamine 5'-phosphate oxidase family protein n=1 Tax=Rhodococcus sp. MS13 TaxID=2579940 RepID=UPI001562180D|nr:pyridoxamine 5'-phosphate oxidase family protein [Rhodococcus sp. MS13]NRH33248.1 pyridoxamine 5'-phosphate oxidase family protein [Rhodococcus sp. MS13]
MIRNANRINRIRERSQHERESLYAILDAGHKVGTLSTIADGKPWVVPMLYARDGDRLLLHGSVGSGALRLVEAGAPAALSVTHMDGWIFAHTMFNMSANYRSAVVHGTLENLKGEAAADALTKMVEGMTPGRPAEMPPHTKKHLVGTQAMALQIHDGQWTAKVRTGEPTQPEDGEDYDPNIWTGVVPIKAVFGEPVPAARHSSDVQLSPSIRALIEGYDVNA